MVNQIFCFLCFENGENNIDHDLVLLVAFHVDVDVYDTYMYMNA